MPRAFTAADIVQTNSGQISNNANPGVGLSSGSTAGTCGLITILAGTNLEPPEQWHTVAASGATASASQLAIMCRADLPAGEAGWSFSVLGGSATHWVWQAQEWTNVSFAPLVTASSPLGVVDPASISTGTTGTTDIPYVLVMAAVGLMTSVGGATWPTVSWSNGFATDDTYQVGTGAAVLDLKLWIARKYGTLNETGPWETTATFSSTMTNKTAFAAIAVFRAENLVGDI